MTAKSMSDKKEETVTITIAIDENAKTYLEACASDFDLTLSRYTRNIIYTALEDYKILGTLKLINLDLFRVYMAREHVDLKRLKLKPSSSEVNISVIIRKDIKEQLAGIAEKTGLTLKQLTRNLIYVGLYDHQTLRRLKMVIPVKLASAFTEFLQDYFGKKNEKSDE